MPTVKLTKGAVEKIPAPDPSGKQVICWDAELRGFGVLASGTTTAKSYIVQRRLPDGRTRRLTVGAVGEFQKVEDARRILDTLPLSQEHLMTFQLIGLGPLSPLGALIKQR